MKHKDDVEVIASLVEKLMNGFHGFACKEVKNEGLTLPQFNYFICVQLRQLRFTNNHINRIKSRKIYS